MSLAIGVDLGGTKIAAAVVDEYGAVLSRQLRPTPTDSSDAVISALVEIIAGLRAEHPVESACVAVPGLVDSARSRLLVTPNLPMADLSLRVALETALDMTVVIENDANAAAWAEVRFGAARNSRNVVMLTVGTGLGGGVVVERNLVRGAFGLAAEVGHMTFVPDGLPCGCGGKGCWEQYSSGNALVRITKELAAQRETEAGILLGLGDGTVEGIAGPHITDAAQQGCPVALAGFAQLGDNLGRGMASVSALIDPHRFIIGGGVSSAGDILLDPIRKSFEAHVTARAYRPLPDIQVATMGNDAGMIGAADLARVA